MTDDEFSLRTSALLWVLVGLVAGVVIGVTQHSWLLGVVGFFLGIAVAAIRSSSTRAARKAGRNLRKRRQNRDG